VQPDLDATRWLERTGIDVRHLRYYLAVFEELHFGRAAERLHIAQPPLSQAIRKLEDELGVTLLDRTTRVVAPTAAGIAFAKHARAVLAALEMAVDETRRAARVGSVLRVGCVPHLALTRLLALLGQLQEREPDVHPRVTHHPAAEQVRRLTAGVLDVGLFDGSVRHADMETERIFPGEALVAFVPASDRLADKPVLRPRDVEASDLVLFPRQTHPALHDWISARMEAAGYRFRRVREAGGGSARDAVVAAANGLGVGLASASFAEVREGSPVRRLPLDPPLSLPDTVVAWRRDAPRELGRVLTTVREIARTLRASELEGDREPERYSGV
jgi:DNA-binding transcriptional LysR family regulator